MDQVVRVFVAASLITLGISPLSARQDVPEDAPGEEEKPDLGPMRTIEFEVDEGTWTTVDVSPDGRTILFDLLGDLYTVPIDGGEARRLLGGRDWDHMPRFSPDGSSIAFISDRDGNMNLWTARADGSELEKRSSHRVAGHFSPLWTPEGNLIVARRERAGTELWLFYPEGGNGVKQPLTGALSGPAVSPDNRYLFVSLGNGATAQILRFDRQTGDSIRMGVGIRPQVSPDGRYLAYARPWDHRTSLHVRDLRSGADRRLVDAITPATGRGGQDRLPGYTFTPDNRYLLISIGGKINRVDVETGAATVIPFRATVSQQVAEPIRVEGRVDDDDVRVRVLRWTSISPDGDRVVFSALGRVYVADLPDGTARRLTGTSAHGREYMPRFSPSGREVAFVSWSDSALGHVMVVSADGGAPRRLTRIPGRYANPVWSADGARLAFIRGGGAEQRGRQPDEETYFDIMWIPAEGGEAGYVTSTVSSRSVGFPMRYYPVIALDADGDRVFYSRWRRGGGPGAAPRTTLYSVRLDGTDRREHLAFIAFDEVVPSPDARRVAFVRREQVWVATLPEFMPEAVDLNFDNPAIPLEQLTTRGGNYVGWQNDTTLTWVFTNRVFRQRVGEDDPEEIGEIELTVPRHKPEGSVAFTNARLVTLRNGGDEVIERGTVVVRGNRIAAVGPSGTVAVPADAVVVNASGKTIVPGLIDSHAHMHYAAFEMFPEQKWEYVANLAYGVTSTFDPSSHNLDVFAQQEMVEAGVMWGPRIFSTGDVIYGTESVFPVVYERIAGIEDARNVVQRFAAYDPVMLKEYMQPRRDARQWLAQAAREEGIMLTAEGGGDLAMDMTMVLDGYTAWEHALPIAPLYDDVVELVARSGVHYTPTLIVGYGGPTLEQVFVSRYDIHDDAKLRRFTPEPQLDRWRRWTYYPEEEWHFLRISEAAAAMTRRGGLVTLGAHGNRQGLGAQWELWGLQMGGLTNLEALKAGSYLGAVKLGYERDLGALAPGLMADLLVLHNNPLDDIRHTADIQYVMKNGFVWDAASMTQVYPTLEPLRRFFWQTEAERRRFAAPKAAPLRGR